MKNTAQNEQVILHHLKQEINEAIRQLDIIIMLIQKEESIKPYESQYCTNCDKSCGRTNAEIYTCVMGRMNQTDHKQHPDETQHYSKEYLEQDLKNLKKSLNSLQKKIR